MGFGREATALSTLVVNQASNCWEKEREQGKIKIKRTFSKTLLSSGGQVGPRDPVIEAEPGTESKVVYVLEMRAQLGF